MSSINSKLLTLISGTALAQIVTFAFMPAITRLYSPADFGEFAVYMFVVNAVQVIACLRYEMAIVLADDDDEAINIIALSLIATLGFCLLSTFGALGFHIYLQYNPLLQIKYPHLQIWLWLMPFFILFLGAYMAFNQWLIRKEYYQGMSIARLSNSLATVFMQGLFGIMKIGANGIAFGAIFAHAIYASFLYFYGQKARTFWQEDISFEKIKIAAKKHQSLPRTTLFQSLLEMLQTNALAWLLPFFYSIVEGGYYSRTMMIFQAPVALIAQALSQVAYREAAVLHRENQSLQPLVLSTLKKSALIGLPICLGLFILGPWAFTFYFGEKWTEAGVYARILALWMYVDFLRVPLAQIAIVIQQQRALLRRSIIGTFILITSVSAGYYFTNDVHCSLYLLSGGMTIFTTYILWWLVKITKTAKNIV